MNIFEADDYKTWLRTRLDEMPNGGRGQLKKIADHLRVSPTIVTQVFGGDRELTPEQAILMADYFAFSREETKFLLLLVNYARAGTHRYRESLLEEIRETRTRLAREIASRVQQNVGLSDETKAVLYSNWYYLAVWSLTAIEGFNDLESIATRLGLNRKKVREALDFLLRVSMVVEDQAGRLRVGPTLVHLPSDSPQIPRHHQSWRLQAFRHYENPGTNDVFYTAPVTLAEADARMLRERLLKFVADFVTTIQRSPSEKIYCICLDWFQV